MSSFNKNLLVAAGFFTLALLIIASHRHDAGATAAPCESTRTGIMCTSDDKGTADETCRAICLQRGGGYTGGYCSTEHVVGDPSCVCTMPCAAQSTAAAVLAGDGGDAGGRMGMAN